MSNSPARHLNLAGASNFRDLGGYPARDGRVVRWRQIFRSNHLGHLTEADIEMLRCLGVRRAFDFRGTEERVAAMCCHEEIAVHSLPVEPTVVAALRARLATGVPLSSTDALEVMRDSYRNYVRLSTQSYRTLFDPLLGDTAPLVIHCTAGKDRTGFACALILHALDVPDELIAEDYLLTNRALNIETRALDVGRQIAASFGQSPSDEALRTFLSVEEAFLRAGFDEIRLRHGSIDAYLEDALGVDARRRAQLEAALCA